MSRSPSRAPAAAAVLVLVALLAVLLTAFAWPAVRSAPHDVPLAVAPPQAAEQVTAALEQARPGAFDVRIVDSASDAERAVHEREVYGAVVAGPDGPAVLTASAASAVIAQALQQVAVGIGQASGTTVAVTDLVPTPADDPRGAGLAAGALPLALGGIVTAGLLAQVVTGLARRVASALAVALLGGLALAGILHGWLGALAGDLWAEAGVMALGLAATALPLLGLHALAGTPGLGVGAAVTVLLGNSLSGAASAPEFLPAGWGTLGSLLPPGATVSALRSVAFFDGAAAGRPVTLLAAWCLAGLALCGLAAARRRTPTASPERTAVPA